jgi:cytidine deaminase
MVLPAEEALHLLALARQAAENAYAPYSDFPVGAALLAEDGRVFSGVNVENVSYGLTICAERSALVSAVSQGYRQFKAIAVIASRRPHGSVTPCGACRQMLSEFMKPDAPVIMTDAETGNTFQSAIKDLLPSAFR